MHGLRIGAALAVAVLLPALAGCTGSPEASTDPADSPLGDYMSSIWGGDLSEDEQIARMEADNLAREELTAECMAEEGFDYIPVTDNGSMSFSSGDEWKPDDREWVAQYGYGMVRSPGMDAPPEEGQEFVDPNQEYVESLSESEREAFYEVLYGPPVPEEELDENGSYEWNWEDSGCSGWAQHELDAKNPMNSDEHKPIMDALNAFYESSMAAPEYVELDQSWSECMADAGHPGYATQMEAQNSFVEDLNSYYENQTEWVENDPALDELAEKEVELALVDLDCRVELDYTEKRRAISVVLEEQFIEDHKAELDALKAAAEQGS